MESIGESVSSDGTGLPVPNDGVRCIHGGAPEPLSWRLDIDAWRDSQWRHV